MKRIFVSQRVDVHPDYGERRDALDQKWVELLWKLKFLCVPTPNHVALVLQMLHIMPPDGIMLTGGNTPEEYGGNAPERDDTDELLISYAVANRIPLFGICRGMQSIVLYFGGSLHKTAGHIAVRHTIDSGREVNSYHAYSPKVLPDNLMQLECSRDGEIECIKHKELPIMGIMWHPERETPFKTEDVEIIRKVFDWNNTYSDTFIQQK